MAGGRAPRDRIRRWGPGRGRGTAPGVSLGGGALRSAVPTSRGAVVLYPEQPGDKEV